MAEPGIGHNGISHEQLRSIVERVERLEEEKKALSTDITEIYAEAKSNGFDTATIREIVKLRKMEASKRREHEENRDLYMHALGMLADTPLGEAAMERLEVGASA